jgi:hypothetical protein
MTDEAKRLLREATSHLQSAIGLDDPSRKITIGDTCDLVTRIDAFLSRPEPAAQEPVAWRWRRSEGSAWVYQSYEPRLPPAWTYKDPDKPKPVPQPLYSAPPQAPSDAPPEARCLGCGEQLRYVQGWQQLPHTCCGVGFAAIDQAKGKP